MGHVGGGPGGNPDDAEEPDSGGWPPPPRRSMGSRRERWGRQRGDFAVAAESVAYITIGYRSLAVNPPAALIHSLLSAFPNLVANEADASRDFLLLAIRFPPLSQSSIRLEC